MKKRNRREKIPRPNIKVLNLNFKKTLVKQLIIIKMKNTNSKVMKKKLLKINKIYLLDLPQFLIVKTINQLIKINKFNIINRLNFIII